MYRNCIYKEKTVTAKIGNRIIFLGRIKQHILKLPYNDKSTGLSLVKSIKGVKPIFLYSIQIDCNITITDNSYQLSQNKKSQIVF